MGIGVGYTGTSVLRDAVFIGMQTSLHRRCAPTARGIERGILATAFR